MSKLSSEQKQALLNEWFKREKRENGLKDMKCFIGDPANTTLDEAVTELLSLVEDEDRSSKPISLHNLL
ncbi:hypothetical protein [Ancylobacter sp. TS-1]|uniref:hypothetical protein n=1 Tax=Ancylobacter sp. TS-1 TaxID=1850374 RepID=UPI001265C182|nr:hypothetical protein [Ancylobacter sp. TS-1]QFR34720.1 hypothetical protein GBB76_17315 [Ancylobacter sp. TS-1]